jgi:hypothetical protein
LSVMPHPKAWYLRWARELVLFSLLLSLSRVELFLGWTLSSAGFNSLFNIGHMHLTSASSLDRVGALPQD